MWYNPTLIQFNKIDDSIDPTSFTFQNGFFYVWNTQNKLLGNEIVILQDFIPLQKQDYYVLFDNETSTYNFYHKSNIGAPISNAAIDLHYTCYINTDSYGDSSDEVIYHNDQYYFKTDFQVIPQLASDDDYDAILISSGQEPTILASDFIIKIDPTKYKITSIVAKENGKVLSTDYINFYDYDRVRFVISDYGRMISHSIHKKDSESMYQQSKVSVFNTKKFNSNYPQFNNYKFVSINFKVNDKNSISNLTANF